MKKKLGLLTTFACFLLCALMTVYGVYAANNITLNVGGTVTFIAEEVSAEIKVQIKGDAVNSSNVADQHGAVSRADYANLIDESTTFLNNSKDTKIFDQDNFVTSNYEKINLKKFYFNDLASQNGDPLPIYIKIEIKNTSPYPIKMHFDSGIGTPGNSMSVAFEERSDGGNVVPSAQNTGMEIAKGSSESVTLKLAVIPSGGIYNSFNTNVNLGIALNSVS